MNKPISKKIKKNIRICVFGASTTYGTGDIEKGGWADRLKVYLSKKNYQNQIFNLGISGATSEMLLERLENEIKPRKPDVIIIAVGSNDSSFRKDLKRNLVTAVNYLRNIKRIYKISTKYTNKIFFVGFYKMDETKCRPVKWNENVFYSNNDLNEYNNILKDFCHEKRVNFINIYNLNLENYLIDGVHPDSRGHEKIFQSVKGCLIKYKII